MVVAFFVWEGYVDSLLSTRAVAELLGVSEPTLRFWRQQGTGPRYAKLGKNVKYAPADVEAWWQQALKEQARQRRINGQQVSRR